MNHKKTQFTYAVVEVLIILIAGIYLAKNPDTSKDILFAIGSAIIVINRIISYAAMADIVKNTEEKISTIAQIIDLRERTKDQNPISDIHSLYYSITESEFKPLKDDILSDTVADLRELSQNKRSDQLDISDFYQWLSPTLGNLKQGDNVIALSFMLDGEWDNTEAEIDFLNMNIEKANSGISIERIFIYKGEDIDKMKSCEPIIKHLSTENKLRPYFIRREGLKDVPDALLAKAYQGFIVFNDKVALIDKIDAATKTRGFVTMNRNDIRLLRDVFLKLKILSSSKLD